MPAEAKAQITRSQRRLLAKPLFQRLQRQLYDLSVRGREERGCLRADVSVNGGPLPHVFDVHLGTSLFERREQGRRLISPELLTHKGLRAPRIVMGDFNEWTLSGPAAILTSRPYLLRSDATVGKAMSAPNAKGAGSWRRPSADRRICLERAESVNCARKA